jgi:phosphate transport system substrate-binding protein
MVFVHRDNPIGQISASELARIFGCPSGNQERPIRYWGQLGLKGEWEHRAIHVYGYSSTTGMARYFQHKILNDTNHWSHEMVDFENGHLSNGEVINAGNYVLQALAKDPQGIGYANVLYANPEVKTVALSAGNGADREFWAPTWANVFSRSYPLTRYTSVFLDRTPGLPVDPRVKEFLRYILSREGMRSVVEDGAYVPLNAGQVEIERHKLE